MYGVSKINIEPSLMMISVQDVEFKGNGLARYLQIFADNGVVVDMISQSAPHGTTIDFSFTASSGGLPLVMKAFPFTSTCGRTASSKPPVRRRNAPSSRSSRQHAVGPKLLGRHEAVSALQPSGKDEA